TKPRGELVDHQLVYAGDEFGSVTQELEDGSGGDGGVKAALLLGGPDHVAPVAAGHDVGGAHADHPGEQPGTGGIVQPQDLTLDRLHGDPGGGGDPVEP